MEKRISILTLKSDHRSELAMTPFHAIYTANKWVAIFTYDNGAQVAGGGSSRRVALMRAAEMAEAAGWFK